MRLSIEWLREYVDFDMEPEDLAYKLSMTGTEVELIERFCVDVSKVVVGEIREVEPHPNAEKLSVCSVADGEAVRGVVCGAPNVAVGQKVALAVPGAELPGLSGRPLRKAEIRGVISDGMICSGGELGLNEDYDGILVLPDDYETGKGLEEVLPLKDVVLELEITPNRPDCMSVIGIAREVAAITGNKMRRPDCHVSEGEAEANKMASIRILDPDKCPRYTARIVTGTEVGDSPIWMQRRLLASGMRPINNVVDITNYVMLEWGQPLHAFDLTLLAEASIIVRGAKPGETITTLDGIERQLSEGTLVIADGDGPVAIAGVMGGADSEVGRRTSDVLIESACFKPESILLTSKGLGLRSEASSRFERGTDPEITSVAATRAAQLMEQYAKSKVARGVLDDYPASHPPRQVVLRVDRVNGLLGTDISEDEVIGTLESLELKVSKNEEIRVEIPTYRRDLEREIDLVEEVARIWGYWNIQSELPPGGGLEAGLNRRQKISDELIDVLLGFGLTEVINVSFMSEGDLEKLGIESEDERRRTVKLMNPLSEDENAMRTTLVPGMLRCAARNFNRGTEDLAIFERGRVFISKGEGKLPEERVNICVLLYGDYGGGRGIDEARHVDYFDLKGVMEGITRFLGIMDMGVLPGDEPFLISGKSARIVCDSGAIGSMGVMPPTVSVSFGAPESVCILEFDEEELIGCADRERRFEPIGRYPPVKVDIAVIVEESVSHQDIVSKIRGLAGSLLLETMLFDIYRGEQIPEGKKSMAFSMIFGSEERTLTDDEVHHILETVIEGLEKDVGAKVRRSGD